MTVFGEKEAKGLWVGDSPAKAAYFGNELVWGGEGPQPQWWGLCLEALDAGSTVSMKKQGSPQAVTLEYSTDAETWSEFTPGTTTVTLANAGDKAFFRAGPGGNAAFGFSDSVWWQFVMTGRLKASGNVMSMLSGDGELLEFPNMSQVRQFQCMFYQCTSLFDAGDLVLPALSLPERCYQSMFQSSGTKIAPKLSATTLKTSSYQNMFQEDQALEEAPSLQSITAFNGSYCCFAMFNQCSSLTAVPALPAATNTYCYWMMFNSCVALSTAPYLPAQNAGSNGYYQMFQNCRNLSQVSAELTSFNGAGSWLNGVAAQGDFYCPTALGTNETITRGASGCPNNWTVHNH